MKSGIIRRVFGNGGASITTRIMVMCVLTPLSVVLTIMVHAVWSDISKVHELLIKLPDLQKHRDEQIAALEKADEVISRHVGDHDREISVLGTRVTVVETRIQMLRPDPDQPQGSTHRTR